MKTDRKVLNYEQVTKRVARLQNEGKTIVFTSGCYDLLHLGHVKHLEYCKTKGDILIINVGNDGTVRALKGKGRPVFGDQVRARMLAALESTDIVVVSEEHGKMDHAKLIGLIKPNLYIVNQTDSHIEDKRTLIEENGGKLLACRRVAPPHASGISTTAIVEQLPRS